MPSGLLWALALFLFLQPIFFHFHIISDMPPWTPPASLHVRAVPFKDSLLTGNGFPCLADISKRNLTGPTHLFEGSHKSHGSAMGFGEGMLANGRMWWKQGLHAGRAEAELAGNSTPKSYQESPLGLLGQFAFSRILWAESPSRYFLTGGGEEKLGGGTWSFLSRKRGHFCFSFVKIYLISLHIYTQIIHNTPSVYQVSSYMPPPCFHLVTPSLLPLPPPH